MVVTLPKQVVNLGNTVGKGRFPVIRREGVNGKVFAVPCSCAQPVVSAGSFTFLFYLKPAVMSYHVYIPI